MISAIFNLQILSSVCVSGQLDVEMKHTPMRTPLFLHDKNSQDQTYFHRRVATGKMKFEKTAIPQASKLSIIDEKGKRKNDQINCSQVAEVLDPCLHKL